MEGMLWKWTNYFSGWQPRWFVLEQGILSYYRSKDDINDGCKGSIKMSVCDVLVHPNDMTRLDLIIPGEAHFYVKAATPQERQQWLVGLGSAKAGLASRSLPTSPVMIDELPEEPLKVKKSELRLYCDLLMQQVHSVKCSVQAKDQPDVEQLNESTSLLSATCDTFIRTLDECLKLAHANIDAGSTNSSGPVSFTFSTKKDGTSTSGLLSPMHSAPRSSISKAIPWGASPVVQRSTSAERYIPNSKSSASGHKIGLSRTTSESSSDRSAGTLKDVVPAPGSSSSPRDVVPATYSEHNGRLSTENLAEADESAAKEKENSYELRIPTFFTKMEASFIDIRLTTDLEIPTIPFLDACQSVLVIFDKLNQTAFAPARLDMVGNIKKINQKYLSSPELYTSLEKMMISEMQSRQSSLSSSATTAILWLNRSLEFIHEIVVQFLTGTEDMVAVVNAAYTKALLNHHGWVVRSAFAMAVKAVPSRVDVLRCLSVDEKQLNHPSFLVSLQRDVEDHAIALDTITQLIQNFLRENNLDSPKQI